MKLAVVLIAVSVFAAAVSAIQVCREGQQDDGEYCKQQTPDVCYEYPNLYDHCPVSCGVCTPICDKDQVDQSGGKCNSVTRGICQINVRAKETCPVSCGTCIPVCRE